MPIIGMLRVKNEGRWIRQVIDSIKPICQAILVLDDYSTDDTLAICEEAGCFVFRSPFQDGHINEQGDKNWLLEKIFQLVPPEHHHETGTYWCLAIDGDEVLAHNDRVRIHEATMGAHHVYSLQVLYLWNAYNRVRVDGVYRNFNRPSLFRLINPGFQYQATPWGSGANLHCANIPQELLGHTHQEVIPGRLLHLGYRDAADRLRKYEWYCNVDPGNETEDHYRHMVIGDVFPEASIFKWAGPLDVVPLCMACTAIGAALEDRFCRMCGAGL